MSAGRVSRCVPVLATAARWLLGAIFIVSAVGKVADPAAFASNVAAYRIIPFPAVNAFSIAMAWTELLVGLSLLNGFAWRSAALLSAVMNVAFIIAVASAMARGLSIKCGCFTLAKSTVGWPLIARDAALLALSVFVLLSPSRVPDGGPADPVAA